MIKDYRSIEHWPFFRELTGLGKRLSPNSITVFGFIAVIVAGALCLREDFALAASFVLVHLICDGLDGHVARKYNKSTELGFLLDHVLDRLSDIVLFVCLGLSLNALIPALLVALLCLFSSYIGVLNKIIGAPQDKGGLFAKSYRYQLLIVLLVIFHFVPLHRRDFFLYFICGSFIIGGATVVARMRGLYLAAIKKGSSR